MVSGNFFKLSLVGALALLVAGCSTVTPYQPLNDGYGFSSERIEDNRFKVNFRGNSLTPRQTVERYVVYRAAEITLQVGGDYFVITEYDTVADTSYRITNTGSYYGGYGGYGYRAPYSSGVGVGFGTGSATPVNKYDSWAEILVFKGDKPADQENAYDARGVIKHLGSDIQRPVQPG
ncbi:CC0125/CC1285 family lipoprotein [Rhodovibrionaceae bacterium A322]